MKHISPLIAFLLALGLGGSLLNPPFARAEDQKSQNVRRLLDLMGTAKLGQQAVTQIIAQMRLQYPGVPAQFWDDFTKSIDPGELIDLMVPVYAKHLDDAEIRELINFYQSPVGRKFTAELPAITAESAAAGDAWGQKIVQKMLDKLQEKGITPR